MCARDRNTRCILKKSTRECIYEICEILLASPERDVQKDARELRIIGGSRLSEIDESKATTLPFSLSRLLISRFRQPHAASYKKLISHAGPSSAQSERERALAAFINISFYFEWENERAEGAHTHTHTHTHTHESSYAHRRTKSALLY